MQDEEFYRHSDEARRKSHEVALNATLMFEVDFFDFINRAIPTCFGKQWERRFSKVRDDLIADYQDELNSLFVVAKRSYHYSIVSASWFMHLMYESTGGAPDHLCSSLATPEGYADHDGWAYSLFNGICAELDKPYELLGETNFNRFPNDRDLLSAMAVVWFFEAENAHKNSEISAMDLLFEASDALGLANGLFMWEGGENSAGSAQNPAAILAKKRHAENYAMIDFAVKYWRDNIDPSISAAKAANELVRIVPLSHKKLAEVIASEKKR